MHKREQAKRHHQNTYFGCFSDFLVQDIIKMSSILVAWHLQEVNQQTLLSMDPIRPAFFVFEAGYFKVIMGVAVAAD